MLRLFRESLSSHTHVSCSYMITSYCVFLRSVYPTFQASLECHFWLALRYYLTFISLILSLWMFNIYIQQEPNLSRLVLLLAYTHTHYLCFFNCICFCRIFASLSSSNEQRFVFFCFSLCATTSWSTVFYYSASVMDKEDRRWVYVTVD